MAHDKVCGICQPNKCLVEVETKENTDAVAARVATAESEIDALQTSVAGKAASGHTHSAATTSANGFMSSSDKTKLNGIATGANKYTLPEASTSTMGGIKIDDGSTSSSSGAYVELRSDSRKGFVKNATTSKGGVMSAADKTKLDGIATGANKITVDSALSSSSTNPVQNKVINTALAGKSATSHTHDLSAMITNLSVGDTAPTDANYFIGSYSGSDTSKTNIYYKKPFSLLWSWIKSKADSIYAAKSHSHSAVTTSTAGYMSAADKTKLDGITTSADSVSFTRNLTSGTKVGTITINGTGTDLYCQTNTNTDTMVKQGVSTSDKWRSILTGYTQMDASTTTPAEETNQAYKAAGVAVQPSTGTIKATTFSGALSGNATTATTATKLGTATKGSATQPIYLNAGTPTACTYTLGKSVPSDAVFTDTNTKNTAGSTNTSSKIFLVGATSQAANPQTYSHDTAYVGTDGCLYSNSTKVSVEGHTHSGHAPTAHASTATTYGIGTGSNYGHVKLSNNTLSTYGESDGVAATPQAVKSVVSMVATVQNKVDTITGKWNYAITHNTSKDIYLSSYYDVGKIYHDVMIVPLGSVITGTLVLKSNILSSNVIFFKNDGSKFTQSSLTLTADDNVYRIAISMTYTSSNTPIYYAPVISSITPIS